MRFLKTGDFSAVNVESIAKVYVTNRASYQGRDIPYALVLVMNYYDPFNDKGSILYRICNTREEAEAEYEKLMKYLTEEDTKTGC